MEEEWMDNERTSGGWMAMNGCVGGWLEDNEWMVMDGSIDR